MRAAGLAMILTAGLAAGLAASGVAGRAAEGDEGGIRLLEVTKEAGLAIERAVAKEKRHLIETMGGGVAFIDFDGDTRLDIYLTNAPTVESHKAGRIYSNRLYRNLGGGRFEDVSLRAGVDYRGWSMGVSVADYDGDGREDIYLTNFGPNVLYRNNGDGSFSDVTAKAGVGLGGWSSSSGWADYDNDGDLDLFVAGYVAYDLNDLPEFGRGKYCLYRALEVLCGPRGMRGERDALYRNNGDGTFTEVGAKAGVGDERGAYGLGVAWSDLDDDGDQDLFVANDTHPNYLYINQGDGTFREAGLLSGAALDLNGKARAGMGIAVGDYDRDGKIDLGVTNFSDEGYALFRNLGGGEFTDAAAEAGVFRPSLPYLGWGMIFADFDQDGWPDLFAANGHVYPQVDAKAMGTSYRERCLLFRNLGRGRFDEVAAEAGSGMDVARAHRGVAVGDYDGDGDQDVLVMDLDGGPVLFENRSAGQGSYLRVKAPVGSRVVVEAAGMILTGEVISSGSYQSASEQVAHFGLGDLSVRAAQKRERAKDAEGAATIERVTVRLPSGRKKVLTGVRVNQTILVERERN